MFDYKFTPGVIGISMTEYLAGKGYSAQCSVMVVSDNHGYIHVFGAGSQQTLLEELTEFLKSDGNSTFERTFDDPVDQETLECFFSYCEIIGNMQDPVFAAMFNGCGFTPFDEVG
jgi:hypothetical protein